jgi:hypothetical protein
MNVSTSDGWAETRVAHATVNAEMNRVFTLRIVVR